MSPCNCHPPFPRPEPFSPLPRPGKVPDWGKWIRDRLAEKGALLAFPTRTAFPDPGAQPNVYEALDTGVLYRWDGTHYQVLVDPSAANDVLEYESREAFPQPGEHGKLYVAADTGNIYRWGGRDYVELPGGKADKVAGAVEGNLAALTRDGNLADSRTKPSDFVGKATLFDNPDTNPTVKSSLLPSYVDDVVEYASLSAFPQPGEEGKIYVALDTNIQYRWSGTQYTEIAKVITPSTSAPLVDGTASAGSSETYSRGDHRHPTDTSRMAADATGADIAVSGTDPTKIDVALAGKASTADATLTERGLSAWVCDPPTYNGHDITIVTSPYISGRMSYTPYANGNPIGILYVAAEDATYIRWESPSQAPVDLVATRTALSGYQLGSQTDKPLASEAEAEALRTGKANKADVDPLLFSQYYPDGSVKSAAEFTAGIKYDDPDTTNRTITVKPFCNTSTAEDDNSSLVGRVVIPPFVDAQGNGYISDDGTRYKVVGVSGGSAVGDNPNLTAIFAPNTVTNIGNSAFFACGSLASISLPATTGIGRQAFRYCALLTSVSLPAATIIGNNAFFACMSLTSVLLPAATNIGDYAFESSTSLASVDFGDTPRSSVPTLGEDAFDDVPTTCKIIVPYTQYDAWIAADGWRDLPQEFVRHAEKADKPATFTTGNLAALDANGNPTDSGVKASDKLDSTSAAPAFSSDSSTQYAVGSHCVYNGKLYKCTIATTGGTWDASKWTADTMTDPDAVLDITSQNQLRVVAKDGTLLWAQGYDLASTSSATLACDAANNFTFADGATTQAFALPTAPSGKAGDFGLDIDNSANTSAATLTLTGLDTAFSIVVPKGESLNDMLAIAAGELARFYITLSTFRVNNLPTWHIMKQIVENGGATV